MSNLFPNHRQRDLERIKQFRLLDDTFMKAVLKDNIEGVQDIIRVLLHRDDIDVISVRTQEELTNLYGHSVRLDVLARDAAGKLYNIEIQRAVKGTDPKRARYHLGVIDLHNLPTSTDYSELPETYIIFVTENDPFGCGLPIYTIDRMVRETGEVFEDGGHILYANGAYIGDDDVGKLMADFRTAEPSEMHYSSLAKKAGFYKNTEGGVESMCRIMEEVREEGRAEGRVEGRAEGRGQMINALLMFNSEDSLLHAEQFKGLEITQAEIDSAKMRFKS